MSRALTYTEAAAILGLSRRTLQRWAHDGRLEMLERTGPRGEVLLSASSVSRAYRWREQVLALEYPRPRRSA